MLVLPPAAASVAKSYWLGVLPSVPTVAQGRMPLTSATPEPRELTTILLKAVFRFWLVPAAPPGRKLTVAPGFRVRVPTVRVAVAPGLAPLVEVMNDAPLFRA